jgi:anaerobic selenocysteine-containing dehydrogenase
VTWDRALDDIAKRIRQAIVEDRKNEIVCHLGRPGEDGFTERVLASWGVDGHNSHTNVCSSGGRAGWHYWTGIDRPSADFAHAKVIYLISAHLETGHYFNPHAQRITEARERGAKLVVLDTRLSNTATHADYWLSPQPGSEAAINLAIANFLITSGSYNVEFVRRWWNWQEYLVACHPDVEPSFENFQRVLEELYRPYSFAFASAESGIAEDVLQEVAVLIAGAGTALASHTWRSASAGNLGGWQVSRTLLMLNALMGAIATKGGTFPNAWNKFVPRPIYTPPHPEVWNELSWPQEYPLSMNELSMLLPHFLLDGRGSLEVYFTRVYNPVWTNPDGFSWIKALSDEEKVRCFVALTPTWNESAFFADYVLPMGHASERHDLHSYEQYDGQWIAFRQPVTRVSREKSGESVADSRQSNPGEVWEENEFWIELSWRIDPDGSMGIRQFHESKLHPGHKLSVEEYYSWIFENSVPGLPERAEQEGLSPLGFMRKYGAFEIIRDGGAIYEQEVPGSELEEIGISRFGRVFSQAPKPVSPNIVPLGDPGADAEGRRPVGVMVDDVVRRGFPTPSGLLEFYSATLATWGWPEYAVPTYIRSHVHPSALASDQMVLISTFRLPTQIHTRSANSKWLDEIAHTNPLWIHPTDAKRLGISGNDLVRVESEIGYFVLKPWITEGIKPGVVACSHHMGRWKPETQPQGQGQMMRTVSIKESSSGSWDLRPLADVGPYQSADPDTSRIWWSDVGVHQNLIFPVHPDPISGMHCWHQAVKVTKALSSDAFGDISVDTNRSREVYARWLAMTRQARSVSPDGSRRPRWLMRPLKPSPKAYELPGSEMRE